MRESSPVKFTLYPLAWLSLCFAAGIAAENFASLRPLFYLPALFSLFVASLLYKRKKTIVVLISAAFFLLGGFCLRVENESVAPNRLKSLFDTGVFVSGEPLEITGVLRGKPELAVGGFFLEMNSESVFYKGNERNVTGRVRLFAAATDERTAAAYENLNLGYGTRVRVACRPEREDEFLNPGVVSRRKILDQSRTDATAVIKSPLLVENLGETGIFTPLAWVYESRQNLILEFKNRFSVSTAGVLTASLLGNRYHLDKSTAESFREGGTFHVLVISGLHITFFGGMALVLVRFLTRRRCWQFLLTNAFLWSYAAAVGAEPPVVRAAVMFTILHFSLVIFRQRNLLNALGATALILLVWRPSELFNQSFQLTFLSVFAIVGTAFPLLEKLKAIGEWQPSEDAPAPPNVSKRLKNFCETLYWSEAAWRRELGLHLWQCELFKTPLAGRLEQLKLQKILRFVFEVVLVSIVVQAWLLPLTIIYFHRVSPASVVLNIWVGILLAIESFTAVFAVFAAYFSEIFAAPFVLLTEICNWLLVHSGDPFAGGVWASARIPVYSGTPRVVYLIYFLPLALLAFSVYRWQPFRLTNNGKQTDDNEKRRSLPFQIALTDAAKLKILSLALLASAFVIIFHPFSAPAPDGRLRVEFLDVGQGDAIFVTMPTGETLLIDGGGKPGLSNLYVARQEKEPELFEPDARGIGERVVSEFLWDKGYSKIDFLAATHADADHLQGLTDAARNFSVKKVFVGRTPIDDADFSEFFGILKGKGVPVQTIGLGDVLDFGEVQIKVLFPEPDDSAEAVSDNNHSLVLRIAYGSKTFLLTGDVERETESELLKTPGFLRADVVKAAHHGSRTSSTEEFVKATRAKYVIFSVGKDSPYGHPHGEIVERWLASGAETLQTGKRGTISFSTDGKDLRVETFTEPE